MTKAAAIFAGSIKDTHPAALFLGLYNQAETGALYMSRESVFKKVYIGRGSPTFVETSLSRENILRVLAGRQKIDKPSLFDVVTRAAEDNREVEELLVESGLLSGQQIQEHLEESLKRRLAEIFCWSDGDYWFEFGEEMPEQKCALASKTPVVNLVWRAVLDHTGLKELNRILSSEMSSPVGLLRQPPEIQGLLSLGAKEIRFLRSVDGARTLDDLIALNVIDRKTAMSLIYVLSLAGAASLLEPRGDQETPSAERGPEDLEYARRVRQERDQVLGHNYFDMLRISRDFDDEQLRRAYYTLSQRYHEEGLFNRADPETRAIAEEIFGHLTAAFEALGSFKRFRDSGRHFALMERSQAFVENRTNRIKSIIPFMDAEHAYRLGDNTKALEHLDEAIELNPYEGECVGLKGEISLQLAQDKVERKNALSLLKKSLSMDSMCERALTALSAAADAEGDLVSANKYYRRLLRLNQENEAVRRALKSVGRRRKEISASRETSEGKEDLDRLKDDIAENLQRLRNATHFEVLGLSPEADREDIKQAYFNLAKRFHPDQLRNLPIGRDMGAMAEELFMKINQAYQVLSSDQTRRLYERSIKVQEQERKIASRFRRGADDPEEIFKQAKVYFKDRVWERALELFNKLGQAEPNNGLYMAYRAYCEFMAQQKGKEGLRALARFEEAFKEAQSMDADNPDICFLWGRMYRVAGELPKARTFFQKALKIDENHIDSLREMRLIKSRIGEEESSGGLLNRLFPRKPREEAAQPEKPDNGGKGREASKEQAVPWYKKKRI